MERLHSYVSAMLPGAARSEMFGGRVVYKVPKEGVGALSVVFLKLEKGEDKSADNMGRLWIVPSLMRSACKSSVN